MRGGGVGEGRAGGGRWGVGDTRGAKEEEPEGGGSRGGGGMGGGGEGCWDGGGRRAGGGAGGGGGGGGGAGKGAEELGGRRGRRLEGAGGGGASDGEKIGWGVLGVGPGSRGRKLLVGISPEIQLSGFWPVEDVDLESRATARRRCHADRGRKLMGDGQKPEGLAACFSSRPPVNASGRIAGKIWTDLSVLASGALSPLPEQTEAAPRRSHVTEPDRSILAELQCRESITEPGGYC